MTARMYREGHLVFETGYNIRLYSIRELSAMLSHAGLRIDNIWGDYDSSNLDATSRRRRPANLDDAVDIVRVLEQLSDIEIANCAASPPDVGVGIENVRRFALTLIHSTKPADITASTPEEVRTVARIAGLFRESKADLIERPLVVVKADRRFVRLLRMDGLREKEG